MGRKVSKDEDLAIQDTLAMSAEERLKLLASLIVDKIDADQRNHQPLYQLIAGSCGD